MKPILTLAVAAAMAFAGQPIYAAHGKPHGGHGRAPGAAAHARVAHAPRPQMQKRVAHAPRPQMRARPNVQRSRAIASQNRARFQQNTARAAQRNAAFAQQRQRARNQANIAARQRANRGNVIAHQRAQNRANATARNRAARIQNNSIAFGGNRTRVNNRVDVRNLSYYHPPVDAYRGWDRGRVHSWNHHRYHWYDGAWVLFDVGPEYYYDASPTVVFSGGVSTDLVARVQAALDRRGYDAGPADGVAGPQTRDAIAAYQDDHGLSATGNINTSLLRSLDL